MLAEAFGHGQNDYNERVAHFGFILPPVDVEYNPGSFLFPDVNKLGHLPSCTRLFALCHCGSVAVFSLASECSFSF